MDIRNTFSNPDLTPPAATNSELTNNEESGLFSGCRSVRLTEDPIPATPTGYVKGKVPVKTIEKKLHFHQLTQLDNKQRESKERIFDQLIPSLMSETGMSQTSVLTKLLTTLEFTPYLRKISSGKMQEISNNPQRLQAELLSELTTRIKQGYKLKELCRLADEPGSGNIIINEQHQTISIGHSQFTREELGDETYRELRDRLSHSGKNHGKDPNAILASLQTRKNLSMAHWQELVFTILKIQDATVIQSIASALEREPGQVLVSPLAQKEWEALSNLIPKLTLITHSGFLLMPILYPWLSAHYLEGDKLSSRHLAWLKSMVSHKLYTQLPPLEETRLNKLCIYKELMLSSDKTANPGVLAAVKDAINDASSHQLMDITDLFAPLLCDLTPSLPAEHRLGIIYTLLKFQDQSLLGKLLHTPSIGRDALLTMYKTQLILTYNLDDQADASLRAENEANVNCLIKTLLVRMALSIILMASKEGVSIPAEFTDKAQTLIDHHNEGLRMVLSPEEVEQQDMDWDDGYNYEDVDSCDGSEDSDDNTPPGTNNNLSVTDYLTIPEHLLANGQTVALDPQHLILPRDKHFRNSSPKLSCNSRDRRGARNEHDEKQLRKDFLLTPRATDLTRPVDWIKMDVPVSFLFAGSIPDSGLSEIWQTFSNELLPLIRQVVINNPLDEPQTLDIIRDLFALAEITGKPGIHLKNIITRIQEKTPDSTLSSLLEHLAIILPKQPGNQERRILLEITAFQLFAELNPSEWQFQHLIKLLYIIQSRSHHLRFGGDTFRELGTSSDSNKLKLKLGKLFRSEWREPDGLLGKRIRRAVKSAIKSTTRGCDYQQVMNALLESMRPLDHTSDTYPNLIHEMCLEVEEKMKQRWEIDNIKQRLSILDGHDRPTYQANLRWRIITLIQSASQLCQQFLPEDSNDDGAQMLEDIAHRSSGQAIFDKISEKVASSSDSYLYEQLKRLIPLIGNWLNEIRDDGLISEEDAFHAGIDKLVQFSNRPIEVSQNPSQLNEDEVLEKIIKLNDGFCHLQKWHSQWQSSHNIASTHNQWLSTQTTLKQIRGKVLPSPDDLQKQITNVISGPESQELSQEDQDMLKTVSTFRTTELRLVQKALDHPDIMNFHHWPEQLTHRITEIKSVWNDDYRAMYAQYQSLTRSLQYLTKQPLYCSVASWQDAVLKDIRKRHQRVMNNLQTTQAHCDLHPVRQLSYYGDPTLLSTLESMKTSHEAKPAGIDTAPLSQQQEQQLRMTLDHKPDTSTPSAETSLFDLIGLGQIKQERLQQRAKRLAKRLEEETKHPGIKDPKHRTYFETPLSKDLPEYQRNNTENLNQQNKKIEEIQNNLNEMATNHSERVQQLHQYKIELDTLLGTRKDSQILIDGQEYSYADAFIGLKLKDDNVSLSSPQEDVRRMLRYAAFHRASRELVHRNEVSWLQLARDCHSRGVSPQILPQVVELMELEDLTQHGQIENKITDLQRQIESVEKTIHEHSKLIEAEVKQLETSLKPEFEALAQKTRDAQQALFCAAFEHGHQLSEERAMQRLLCQYLHEGKEAASIKADIITDYEALEKHIPTARRDCIEPPQQDDGRNDRLSPRNLVFHIINVPGAFPLMQSFHEQGRLTPWQMLSIDAGGKPSSALIFSAAKGRYMACETLIKSLNGTRFPYSIDLLNRLLTANPSDDNRNLLHHIAGLAKPETLGALLQLLNNVSKKQDFDPDYPTDSLKNQVALDREYFIKSLLTQEDYEGLHPTDLLLFNMGKKIREWPEGGEQALTSFCNDFLINDAKNMWIVAAESLSANQLYTSIKCFMKGISDLEQLSPAKREAAETLLKNLVRIFRVHGPDGLHEDLMARIRPEVEAMEISDAHSHDRPHRS